MSKRWKKATGLLLAFLMVLGTLSGSATAVYAAEEGDGAGDGATVSGSTTNEIVWNADALLAAATEADNGLQLMGAGWTKSDDAAKPFGTDGSYAKAGTEKPSDDAGGNDGVVPTKGCFIKYTAAEDGKWTICGKTQKNKSAFLVNAKGEVLDSKSNTSSASVYEPMTADVTEGETYYAYWPSATANVFLAKFTPTQVVRTWNADALLAAATEADNGLQLMGAGWTKSDDAAKPFGTDGSYAKAGTEKPSDDAGGNDGVVPTKGCFIKYTAAEDGKWTICGKTQKNKSAFLVNAKGEVLDSKSNTSSASVYEPMTADVTEGETYYAYWPSATANVFLATLTVGEKQATPWADVAAPVIDKISTDEDGNIVVDFTAKIDAYKGAEKVRITMYYEGHEASTITVDSQKSSVTFTPLWSGNYSFKAVAQRSGEADKASEEKALQNYVLPVKKPIIELAQNKGAGAVYLDWINVESADYFNVYYNESGAEA